jgi:hypothetical protein
MVGHIGFRGEILKWQKFTVFMWPDYGERANIYFFREVCVPVQTLSKYHKTRNHDSSLSGRVF